MDLIASKEHTFGDQIDWTSPTTVVPVTIEHNHAHIGMFAAQHGYDDVLDQWFRDGGDHRQELSRMTSLRASMGDRIPPPATMFGVYIDQYLNNEPSEGRYRCMERWLQAIHHAGDDIHAHGGIICMRALMETASVRHRQRHKASAPLQPLHCPLMGLFNPPDNQPKSLPTQPCQPHGKYTGSRVITMMVNHGFNIWSWDDGITKPVLYDSDTRTTISDTVGSVVASLPVTPEDHGLIVTQALLHRMGYDVPHRDVSMEMHAMRTPMGSAMMQAFMPHIHDATIMSEWVSHLT
jgi:hypothetical protein